MVFPRVLALALTGVFALGVPLDSRGGPANELRRFFEQTHSIEALFHQEVRSAEGKVLSSGHGDMSVLRPNFLRWNYRSPEPLILVSDGLNFWSHDPVLEQSTVVPLEDALRDTPLAVLLGTKVLDNLFEIESSWHQEGTDWIALRSRQDADQLGGLLIGLRTGVLEKLFFTDQFGQEVRVRFEQVQTNPTLQPESFSYRPPPGTDIWGTPLQ